LNSRSSPSTSIAMGRVSSAVMLITRLDERLAHLMPLLRSARASG
jgi:hypothetical protein